MHHSNFVITVIYFLSIAECTDARKKDILKSSVELLDKEQERLMSNSIACYLKSVSRNELDVLRANPENTQKKTIACHITFLKDNVEDGWIWSSLGTIYLESGTSKHSSMANNCFKQAAKLNGNLSKYVKRWHYLGPFVIGKAEVDGDPVEAYGGIRNISYTRLSSKPKRQYVSELGQDGLISWETYPQGGVGDQIQVVPKINWNELVNSLGSTGITEWQGWMVGEFAVNGNNVNVVLQCQYVHTVFVDHIVVAGDVYRRDWIKFSVSLGKGIHTIYARLRGKGPQYFRCELTSASTSFEIGQPHYMPDLYDGYLFSNYIYIPISNRHSSKWLKNLRISVQEHSSDIGIDASLVDKQFDIAPGQTRQVIVMLMADSERVSNSCTNIEIKVKISTSEGALVYPLTLRCRRRDESFIFTFLDHDGSVQHAAAVHPIEDCPQGVCPTMLTLHGTTVPAQNQADSYKRMVDGKYVFGIDKAWLLAPTRHGAHNWEGPGALTALTALDALAALTNEKEWLENVASNSYVVYAGHSMGGHGAWHLATHFPDKALALVSLAGWIKKEEYGDSNLFFRHDISTSYVDPAVKYVMEACINENDADHHASNLHGIPIFARIGANDRTIHPFLVRRMYRVVKEWGLQISYVELPGKEHWWWDTKVANDGGCVNDQQVRDFTNRYSSIKVKQECDENSCGDDEESNIYSEGSNIKIHFTLTVKNPAFVGSMRGIRILQQITPFRTSVITVGLDAAQVELSTTNVLILSISRHPIRPVMFGKKTLVIDGTELEATISNKEESWFCRKAGKWENCQNDSSINSNIHRGPTNYGPARRVAESPFIIVIGTQGSEEMDIMLREFGVYIANLFFMTSDTAAPIVKDDDVTAEIIESHNLIIIGHPMDNSKSSEYLAHVPLQIEQEFMRLGQCGYSDPQSGALFLAPSGNGKLALVLTGNSLEGLRDVVSLAAPTIPPMTRSPFSNMLPDFVITGPQYRLQGPGGYLCAGFWGNHWELRPDLISCAFCPL